MAIIKQRDKRSGITYVYDSVSYWDKEKQQPRSKRTLLGRLDPETGEIVPTDGRGKRRSQKKSAVPDRKEEVHPLQRDRLFFGATYLLDQIGVMTGVSEDLEICFPQTYRQILSLAYYLVLEDQNSLSRFKKWAVLHKHPFGKDIPSPQCTELFRSVTEEAEMRFFRLQARRHKEETSWTCGSTFVSGYSGTLKQLSLALVFGEESGLPFCFREVDRGIPDRKMIRNMLQELDIHGSGKIRLVPGGSCYAADSINALYEDHMKFLCAASESLPAAREFIREIGPEKERSEHYSSDLGVYAFTKTISWNYGQKRNRQGMNNTLPVYLHLYFSPDKATEDESDFSGKLDCLREELLSGRHAPEHESDYRKYFEIRAASNWEISISLRQDAIDAVRERHGFFILVSNEVSDPVTALGLCRLQDTIGTAFRNIKERLNPGRTAAAADNSPDGRLFVGFIALIYLSWIRKRMRDSGLLSEYTLYELLDELDVIECIQRPGKQPVQGEVLNKQEQIYRDLGVRPLKASPEIC